MTMIPPEQASEDPTFEIFRFLCNVDRMTTESIKPRGSSRFNETHWSMVIAAGQKDSQAGEAL